MRVHKSFSCLRECTDSMRDCIVWALGPHWAKLDVFPIASLTEPLIRRAADVATAQHVRPDEVQQLWVRHRQQSSC